MFLRKASSSVFGVARFDASGAAISADARYQTITGADAKALETDTGMRTWRGALTPKGGKLADAPVWKALAKGEPQYVEYRVTKNGAAVWVGATLAPETDGRGRLRAVVEHAVDITAHKSALGDRDDAFEALERSMAIVEFDLDGVILKANDVFLSAVGRDAKAVVGRKHGAFVAPEDRDGDAYGDMMSKLRQGERQAGVFRRRDADGREFWLQATYSPILDAAGAPVRVLELATDVTDASASAVEAAGRDNAMNRSQAVIEFELDGTIIKANKNFLDTVGYSLEEIVGQKHSMFVAPEDRAGAEYKALWDGLRQGEFQAGEFRRVGKNDREIWLQASYNPIFNAAGKPIRVVKFALDATAQKQAAIEAAGKLQAISRSQAVIEFELDGTVIAANDNFLAALGYEASEVVGRHHRIFVPPQEAENASYKAFWESLGRGEFKSGEYERRAKDGSEIWIQATYNPILDAAGKPYKVVKFASDVTAQKREREAAEAERRETTAAQSAVVGALSASLGRMAEGDLTAAITTRFAEEYEGLRSNFNKAQEELRRIIENVVAKAASFDSGAGEVNRATDDLARRTESQAAALEETFAALNQINEGLSTTAASADKAAKVTSASVDSARNGEGVVQRSLNAMTEIEKSSKNVVGIVAVIEDIAFQTNLLALNAGVEAARAGESGRGFAVVASEVRSLSQRCAEAAKEIKDLIMATDAQIVTGVELVRETGESLAGIAKHIGEISELVSGISRESAEQSTGVGEIIVAMRQLDEVTQQNAAMGEEMSAASADLQSESSEMATLVSRFRTGSEPSAQPAARKPVRARAGAASAPKPAAAAPAAKPAAAPAPARPKRTAASGAAAAAAVAEDEDGWEEF